MNRITLSLMTGLLLATLVLTGCGGGGGGANGIAGGSGVEITVLPDTYYTGTSSTPLGISKASGSNSEHQIVAKLDTGAKIEAFDFETGDKLGETNVGNDGKGILRLPSGKTVLIIVTGKRNGKPYRLSTIIPSVNKSGECYVGPAETLAAEAIAQKHYRQTPIDDSTWESVLEAAQDLLEQVETPDISIGGGLITDAAFGTPGSIDQAGESIINEVPDEIDSSLIKAKNIVRRINETATPLQDILHQEYLGINDIAFATYQGIEAAGLGDTFNKYQLLGDRLSQMMIPLLDEGFYFNGDYDVTLDELEVGKKYKLAEGEWSYEVTEIPGGVAGKVTVIKENGPNEVLTVVAREVGKLWEVKQTSSSDSNLNYTITMSLDNDGDPENFTISLKDKDITTAVTFNGSINTVKNGSAVTTTFAGSLTSKEVNVTQAKATIYQDKHKVNRVVIQNLQASYQAGSLKATIRGQMAADIESKEAASGSYTWEEYRPTSIDVSELKIEVTADGKTSSFNLSGKIDVVNFQRGNEWYTSVISSPTNIEALSFSASLDNDSVKVEGTLEASAELRTVGSVQRVFPTRFVLSNCKYIRKGKTSLNGTFTGEWENPGYDKSSGYPEGTIDVDATLKRAGYDDLAVKLKLDADGSGGVVLTVTKLGWSDIYFAGSGAATWSAGTSAINTATLTLESNNGVTIDFTDKNMNGSVKVGGVEKGTISKDEFGAKVDFPNGTTTDTIYLIGNPAP
ncbi:MAG: hypothetical protein ACOX3G_03805 [Armatimonadota bacterium]